MTSILRMLYLFSIVAISTTLFSHKGITGDSWKGEWKADSFSAQDPVCTQKWKCINPSNKTYDESSYILEYTPMDAVTEGVCGSSKQSPGCSECLAETPPTSCEISLKKK